MKLVKNGEAGQMLVLVLVLLALGPLMVVPMLQLSYGSQRFHQFIETSTLNACAADSGIEYGRYHIYNYPTDIMSSGLEENFVLNNVDVQLSIEYDPGTALYMITATAAKAERSLTIVCAIIIDVGLYGNVVACDGDLIIFDCTFDSTEEGGADIYTHGDITITGNSYIDGDAKASGTVTVIHPAEITGEEIEGATVLEFPAINAQIHEDKAKAGSTYNGDMTLQGGTHYLGPLYIDGKLDVSLCDLVLDSTVYVTGDVSIDHCNITGFGDIVTEGNLDMSQYSFNSDNPETLPLLMSVNGNISIDHDSSAGESGTQAVLYAPAPNCTISLAFVELRGSVAASRVLVNTAEINYPAELRGRADLPGASLDTVVYTYE